MISVADTVTTSQPDATQRLLTVVRNLVKEVHPSSTAAQALDLDSLLDRDLGLDSLSRVELFARVEREFDVDLPERLLGEAQTPGDFLNTLLKRTGIDRAEPAPLTILPDQPTAASIPQTIHTLTAALAWQAAYYGERIHIHLHAEGGIVEPISYQTLYREARALAAGLHRSGFKPGQMAALMLPTGRDFFCAFSGILLAGGVPVPIYPPTRLSQLEEHLLRQKGILNNAEVVALLTVDEAKQAARLLRHQVPSIRLMGTISDLAGDPDDFREPLVAAQDPAFLQYTSGSTGNPKGVVLSHANLLANIRGMGDVLHVTPDDVFVSWLPLYHDMGLIGAWLGALCIGYPLAIMSPLTFLSKPARWLKAIHQHRGTIAAAPNFAYELCATQIGDKDLVGLDLSSWRVALNGAEPVSPDTIERFAARFSPYGFREEAMLPAYGLAESTVGVAFPPPSRRPRIDRIQRAALASSGSAIPVTEGDTDVLRVVCCGAALPGHRIRIADEQGNELPERVQGHLQFKGPSATTGYYRNPHETARIKQGDWLDSFDLAYLAGGEVYITGRAKDLIIRAGRNVYPYELELAVGSLPGMRKGCVAVFGSRDPQTATERLVVVGETKQRDPAVREALRTQINGLATDLIGSPPDVIVLAPPHAVLKTSSGKIRRITMRERFEQGTIGQHHRQSWRHLARLGASGLTLRVSERLQTLGRLLYGLYAAAIAAVFCLITWLAVAVLPSGHVAYRVARVAARTLLRVCALSPRVSGLAHLPAGEPAIIVSNHASYLDGVLLFAILPGWPRFTVKGELEHMWMIGLFLRKLGVQFVERFAVDKSVADAQTLTNRLEAGESVVFFPEGTFRRPPGLLPFRLGAFSAAVRTQTPILPVAIQGTRAILPEGNWLPRHGRMTVTICPPITPIGNDFHAALALRGAGRTGMLHHLNEPDITEPTDTALTAPRRQD